MFTDRYLPVWNALVFIRVVVSTKAAAAVGAAGIAYAPDTLLAFSTQLRLCSKNGSFLSWDTMEHPPFFRYAKSARSPEHCGRQVKR